MKCPYCSHIEDKVVDSRPTDEGTTIRRRRECLKCQKRFTTYEKVEILPLIVIKKDNSREPFKRHKILNGVIRACEKRPVAVDQMEKLIEEIENELSNSLEREVPSKRIGELVITKLKKLDPVAYVRFASVYREFDDVQTFIEEINKIKSEGDSAFMGKEK